MHRKLLPMVLLDACGGDEIEGRTRLQKLVFLMEQELGEQLDVLLDGSDYNFIAYDYGPFSKQLYDDLEYLDDAGLIEMEEEDMANGKIKFTYRPTDKGQKWVQHQLSDQNAQEAQSLAEDLKSEYNGMLLSDLIDEVYAEYPKFAENSVW
ncbi:hypothetical protein NDI76_02120 [Halogeometricum sp. S1BR25-6]|uniref:Antitoxin SocA-like Panacea domain-containing protein n=1 Tax=Halogeometricum salsisoli TaxID=2950536 RepID=A0ABU2G9Q1_9EURY|nr:hypothetical protein [Halogeometricum sp. S1BR25-6]MDS0297537.1 hypothetical protein [Halogeometricum sp. S1BR25-6]